MDPSNATPASHAPSAPTRMQRLREATHLVHTRIEASLPLVKPSLTLATYVRVLEGFHGFYAPLEPRIGRLAAASGASIAIDARAKVPLLRSDLRALGKTPADVDALPVCSDVPRVTSASQAIGVLYVLEGATLGGQIIGRHLRERLGLDAASGAAFFGAYGDQTGAMWTRFARHVNTSPGIDTEAAVGAAVETFEKLLSWLERVLAAS